MPWLTPDDDVRRLEAVWVEMQPTARFVSWGVWLGVSLATAPILAFALPTGALIFGAAVVGGYGRRRDKTGLAFTVLLVLLAMLVLPVPSLLSPLPWLVALLLAPAVGVVVARQAMSWIRYETPIRYWLDVIHLEVAGHRGTPRDAVTVKGLHL